MTTNDALARAREALAEYDSEGPHSGEDPYTLVRDLRALAEAQQTEIKRLETQAKMREHQAQVLTEQYRQAYQNYSLCAQALSRHAPEAMNDLRASLYESVNEQDKVMIVAQTEQQTEIARLRAGVQALLNDYRSCSGEDTLDDWYDTLNELLGGNDHE